MSQQQLLEQAAVAAVETPGYTTSLVRKRQEFWFALIRSGIVPRILNGSREMCAAARQVVIQDLQMVLIIIIIINTVATIDIISSSNYSSSLHF